MANSSALPPRGAPADLTSFGGNALLAALSKKSLQSFASYLQPVLFHTETTLFENDADNEAVYFPKSGVILLSLHSVTGIAVEVGLVGSEGVAGLLDALTGDKNSVCGQVQSVCGQVQIAGSGWCLPSSILREEFEQNAELRAVLLGYQRALSKVTAQNVLCNRLHSTEQRLTKSLLLAQDRVRSQELELTHECIATMMGTRRVSVSLAANSLRNAGLIDYRRSFITILDRPALEDLACGCYPILKAQYD